MVCLKSKRPKPHFKLSVDMYLLKLKIFIKTEFQHAFKHQVAYFYIL